MKKLRKALLSAALLFSVSAFSQNADERIGALINQSEWFILEKTYPELKDSMHADFLKLMSEVMIGYYFNRPDDALASISELLADHQSDIGASNAINMAILACQIEGMKGNYAKAAQEAKNITDQLKQQGAGEEICEGVNSVYHFYDKLKTASAPSITRPKSDVSIPVDIEKVILPKSIEPEGWRGTAIFMPVEINGKTYRFIFDTGAGTTAVSEQMAEEIGLRVLNDSIMINSSTPGAKAGKMGVLDLMRIGDIDFHNSLVTVLPENKLDGVLKADAILGMDFIGLFDEIRIYPKERRIVFPVTASAPPTYGRNLIISDRILKLNTRFGDDEVMVVFDTGCSTAGMNYTFYEKYKKILEASGRRDTVTGGGFNFINRREVLRVPSLDITVGDKSVVLKNLTVDISNSGIQPASDMGILGMDMINQFDSVVINLKDMFLKLE